MEEVSIMALGLTVSLRSDFEALPEGNSHGPCHASPFQDAGTYRAGTCMIIY